jgi:HD-like signal output (HDOD) protein
MHASGSGRLGERRSQSSDQGALRARLRSGAAPEPARVAAAIKERLQDLPALPGVVLQIVHACDDAKVSAEDLNKIISTDAGLAARVLRLANSAYYGFPQRIGTITHSIVILGFNAVRNLAMSSAVMEILKPGAQSGGGFGALSMWEHALASGIAAKLVAQHKRFSTNAGEEAFVTGLLHDLGRIVLHRYFPEDLNRIVEEARADGLCILDLEEKAFGMPHTRVGGLVAAKWSFKATLQQTCLNHHDPDAASSEFEYEALASAGNHFAHLAGIGDSGDPSPSRLTPTAEDWLNLTGADKDRIVTDVAARYEEAKEFLHMVAPDESAAAA